MAQTPTPGVAAPTLLNARDNERAVDVIERAERSAPYCACGAHMIAVAHGQEIWLECSSRRRAVERTGLAGLIGRMLAVMHTRRLIMEVPAA
jgi:hypothetical protein